MAEDFVQARVPGLRTGRLQQALELCLWLAVAIALVKMMPSVWPRELVDFDVFYLAGAMTLRGAAADTYGFATLLPEMIAAYDAESFMPWTYPPPFDLVVAGLALMPRWLAYLVFVGVTLGAYLAVIRRLAGPSAWLVLAGVFTSLVVGIFCGQNGMLTGTLIGLFCLGMRRGHWSAGVPLGLMCIKPHIAIGFAVYVLLTRRWGVVAAAAATVALCFGIATLALGPAIWPAFLGGVAEAKIFLSEGMYPLYRMVSLYAAAFTLGAPAPLAAGLQMVQAIVVLVVIVWAALRGIEQRQVLALAAIGSVMVSPYAYGYDLPVVGIGLALLMPEFARWHWSRAVAVLGLVAVSGFGVLGTWRLAGPEAEAPVSPADYPVSLGGLAMPVVLGLVLAGLAADKARARADARRGGAIAV